MSSKSKRKLTEALFLVPTLLAFVMVIIIPFLYGIYYSFTKYDMTAAPEWIGFDNYVKLAASMVNTAQLHDSDFRMLPGEARMGEVWLEYIPRYADINEIVLDMFYRKTE